jgi:hypothetical protein
MPKLIYTDEQNRNIEFEWSPEDVESLKQMGIDWMLESVEVINRQLNINPDSLPLSQEE